eukprot:NODE_1664_length_1856_cov_43.519331_g1410_i0.p1 GENE.NODE_1664_length_1856_cov_43.519331_g1410_i0~~NODE_1664_length_1856_cov_43.519331_g1410_i0.p1  ORF type:complete len:584 (+),score=66.51 NODE_1664_length_1856_cov_43.519331_g1410_i0:65-1753(+)
MIYLNSFVCVKSKVLYTIAGTGASASTGDLGQATAATLYRPYSVYSSGNYLWVSEELGQLVRMIDLTSGIITRYAGTGVSGPGTDNTAATNCALNTPRGIHGDATYLYIADLSNYKVRRVVWSTKTITTFAGTGSQSTSGNGGQATLAQLTNPTSVLVVSRIVYISQTDHVIRKVDTSNGIITNLIGTGTGSTSGDNGPIAIAGISDPQSMYSDGSNLYFLQSANGQSYLRRILLSTQSVYSYAGTGSSYHIGDGGPAESAQLAQPYGLTGNSQYIYSTERYNHYLRRISVSTGTITTYSGTGVPGSNDSSVITSGKFNNPIGIFVSSDDSNIWIADNGNNKVRCIGITVQPRIIGDPHLVGLSGGRYTIKGEHNAIYNAFSDTFIHWNMKLKKRSTHGGTYLSDNGILVYNHKVILDPIQWSAKVDNETYYYIGSTTGKTQIIPLGPPESSFMAYLRIFNKLMLLKVPCLRITFIRSLKRKSTKKQDYFNLIIQKSEPKYCENPHGILGVTWNKKAIPTGPDGEGVLEGHLQDYKVDNLLSCEFKYTKFHLCFNSSRYFRI